MSQAIPQGRPETNHAVPLASPIIHAQGVFTLVGRAWNLFQQNWQVAISAMVGPVLLQTLVGLMSSLITNGTFLTATTAKDLLFTGLMGLGVLGGQLIYMLILSVCGLTLSRYFYALLLSDTPFSLEECIRYTWKRFWALCLWLLIAFGLGMLLIGLIALTLLVGVMVSSLVAVGLSRSHLGALGAMAGVFAVSWGFLMVVLLVLLLGFLFGLLAFPLLSLATDMDGLTPAFQLFRMGIRQAFFNLGRLIPFMLVLIIFSGVMTSTLLAPVVIWMGLELQKLAPALRGHFPVHVTTAFVVANGLAQLVNGPFTVAAMTLFWYDCRVRREGLDLTLWLNRLRPAIYGQRKHPNSA